MITDHTAATATAIHHLTQTDIDNIFAQDLLPHMQALYRFAYKLAGNAEAANDLVQDTYLKAARYIGSYKAGTNAKAWLFRILKNSFINDYRRRARGPVAYAPEDLLHVTARAQLKTIVSSNPQPSWMHNLVSDEVARAIARLPIDYRVVLLLCDVEEFSYDEIASIIGIPVGTVRSRLHRARNVLRELLSDYAQAQGYAVATVRACA